MEQVVVIRHGSTIKASGLASLTFRPILFLVDRSLARTDAKLGLR